MVQSAEAALGERIERLVVGRPVRFSEDEKKNEAAAKRLADAWSLVGSNHVCFVEEPIGAAMHYAAEAALASGQRLLIFDFGGGTLDMTVAEASAG